MTSISEADVTTAPKAGQNCGPFTVYARNKTNEAMDVEAGDVWSFSAKGRWTDWFIACGPEGYRNFLADILQIEPRVAGQNLFCLCGEVTDKDGTESFAIGRGCTYTFKKSGRLNLFANDLPRMYWNNDGDVTVNVERGGVAPGPDTDAADPTDLIGWWQFIHGTVEKTRGVGTLAILVLGACLILALLPQGVDLVRAVGDDSLDAPKHQLIAFVLGLLFLGIQSWLWPRVVINFNYGMNRSKWKPKRLLEWGPRVLGVAPFVLVLFAMRNTLLTNPGLPIILILSALGFLVLLIKREDWTKGLRAADGRSRFAPWWIALCLLLAPGLMAYTSFTPVAFGHALGAPAVVFIGLGLIIPPMIIAIQSGSGLRLPIVGGTLLAAVVFSWWMDNHEVGRRAFGRGPAPMTSVARPDLAAAYKIWRSKQGDPKGGALPIVLVASEGGASRAGDWTAEVLGALHQQSGGKLASSLFAISSVSGGSVGAVGYSALLHAAPALAPDKFALVLPAFTGQDALSPTLTSMLFSDLLQRFVPFPVLPDRAEALERAWETGWNATCPPEGKEGCADLMQKAFLTLSPRQDKPWLPILIVNGASEETGRRILTSTVDLGGAIDADDFHTIVQRDVRISTAISNGARFPWISPAGTLKQQGKRQGHLLDGGYFDAAGVATIGELAQAIAGVAGTERLHFIFVFIGYDGATEPSRPPGQQPTQQSLPSAGAPAKPMPPSTEPPRTQSDGARLLNEVLAPLIGLFASRTAHAAHIMHVFHNATAPTGATAEIVPLMLCQTEDFEPPMDWALSDAARKFIHGALGSNGKLPCASANAEALRKISGLITK
ncbi:hypothetical protein ACFFWD_19105 [Bradyrhizobium erythrophlei]|uniref:hypothetical protein n=1 Tax=Bradyrhizobium erythrophlei TaxID=1437360 RepID=UPI0035E53CDA